MKVLHVIPSLAACRGGASKAAIDMVCALRRAGVDAELACTNDNGPAELNVSLDELVEFEGVPVRFFSRFSPSGDGRIATAIREFAYSHQFSDWLKQNIENYDVLHVHALFSFTSSFAMSLARKRGVPYLAHPIGSLEHWSLRQSSLRKKIFLNLFERRNLRGASLVHFTADSERSQAMDTEPLLRPLVLPLGLELPTALADAKGKLREQTNSPAEIPIIAFVARLHQKKGLELLLHAISSIKLPCRLLIAGAGDSDYKASLINLVAELNLGNSVEFLGYVEGEHKDLLLQGADLFALTSHAENFGIAVIEALASGTAVLVSEGVGVSAAVKEHKLGAVCELSVDSIATHLEELLQDRQALQDTGQRGRIYVGQHHQWSHIAHRLRQTYDEIAH